jgi:hypothetical protein
MRVTGDCLRDARAFVFAADFFIGLVDFFAALFRLAAGLDALFDAAFDALFALLLPRDAARFDAVDDLRRVFPPDDFDADAMINSSRKVRYNIAQDSRAMSSPMRDKKTTRRRPSRRSWSETRRRARVRSRRRITVSLRIAILWRLQFRWSCVVHERDSSHTALHSRRVYTARELTHADSIRFRIDAVSTTNRKFGILR